ncbi:MAG: lipoyl(octanoyl) transferase [Verrucomicrobiota bacterium]|jgi:lipoate-protein ligase A
MNSWLMLRHPALGPAENMAWDEALLEAAPEPFALSHPKAHSPAPPMDPVKSRSGCPVLRVYSWSEPAATFGYFQKYFDVESLTRLRPLIRRPTGGGLVPHDADWTYSIVMPPGHAWYSLRAIESYRRMHDWIRAAFAELDLSTQLSPVAIQGASAQCFIGASECDVVLDGRKLAGAAQRRTKTGLLIQGSIQPPAGIQRSDWESAMLRVGTRDQGASWENANPGVSLQERVCHLAKSKYSQPAFNRRR